MFTAIMKQNKMKIYAQQYHKFAKINNFENLLCFVL